MTTAAVAGSTGLVGSHILSLLSAHSAFAAIYAYTRKDLPPLEKITAIKNSDSASWPSSYPPGASILFSSLGTTRAQAGGFANQKKIDLDLNVALATAGKAAGTKVYVLISSADANSSSQMGYSAMKGQLEDAVKALNFDHCIILRPGLLIGPRKESRPAESAMQQVAGFMGSISGSRLKDFWAQDADVVARAAVTVGLKALKGEESEKVRIVGQAEILRLGRPGWK